MIRATGLLMLLLIAGCSSVGPLAINYTNSTCTVTQTEVKQHIERKYPFMLYRQTPANFAEVNLMCAGSLKLACAAVGCTSHIESKYWSGLTGAHRVDIIAHEYYHQLQFMGYAGGAIDEKAAVLFGKQVAAELCGADTD